MHHIFLETSGQIQLTGGDFRFHDHHQEDQDDQDVLQVQGCSWWLYLQQIPMYHIFLETSGQIQLNGGDTRYLDCHQVSQDDQEDQECPPSTRMFLMALFATNTHVSYIFGNLRTNPVKWWWHQIWSWLSGMSSKHSQTAKQPNSQTAKQPNSQTKPVQVQVQSKSSPNPN